MITPYQLAFYSHYKKEPAEFEVISNVIDLIFFADIVISFNTSYFDTKTSSFSVNRKAIALNYLKTWFVIDIIAILPFETIF